MGAWRGCCPTRCSRCSTRAAPRCAELLFRIGNQSVSNVSALGPQLTGIMHGFDDEHVTYGEDVVQVHVRLLSGVRVHTP